MCAKNKQTPILCYRSESACSLILLDGYTLYNTIQPAHLRPLRYRSPAIRGDPLHHQGDQ
jgi:hypothetical protein